MWDGETRGVTTSEYGVSFWSEENVLIVTMLMVIEYAEAVELYTFNGQVI